MDHFALLVIACADPIDIYEVLSITDAAGLDWTLRSQVQMLYTPESSADSPAEANYVNVQVYSTPLYEAYPSFSQIDVQLNGTAARVVAATATWLGTSGFDAWPSWPTSAKDETGEPTPATIAGNNITNPTGGRMLMLAVALDQTLAPDTGWTEAVSAGSDLKVLMASKDFDSDGDATGIAIGTGTNLENWIVIGDALAAGELPHVGPAPLPAVTIVAIY